MRVKMPFQSHLHGQCKQEKRKENRCVSTIFWVSASKSPSVGPLHCGRIGYGWSFQDVALQTCFLIIGKTALRSLKTMRLQCSFLCIPSTLRHVTLQIDVPPQSSLHSVTVDGALRTLGPTNSTGNLRFSHDNSDTLKHRHIGNSYTRIIMQ